MMQKCFGKLDKLKIDGTLHKIESGCHSLSTSKIENGCHQLSASHGKFIPMIDNVNYSIDNTIISETNSHNNCKIESGCHQLSSSHGKLIPMIDNNLDIASSTYVNNPIIPETKPLDCIIKNKKYQIIIGFDKDLKGAVWPSWMKEPAIHALGIDNITVDISGMIENELSAKIIPVINKIDNHVNVIEFNLNTLSGNFINLSTDLNDVSSNVIDNSKNIFILSSNVNNLTQYFNLLSTNVTILSTKTDEISHDVTSISSNVNNLTQYFNSLSVNLNVLSNEFNLFKTMPATISSLGLVKSSDKINQISVLEDGLMEINAVSLSKISQDVELIISSWSIEEEYY